MAKRGLSWPWWISQEPLTLIIDQSFRVLLHSHGLVGTGLISKYMCVVTHLTPVISVFAEAPQLPVGFSQVGFLAPLTRKTMSGGLGTHSVPILDLGTWEL